jgi:hypothetical protein
MNHGEGGGRRWTMEKEETWRGERKMINHGEGGVAYLQEARKYVGATDDMQ